MFRFLYKIQELAQSQYLSWIAQLLCLRGSEAFCKWSVPFLHNLSSTTVSKLTFDDLYTEYTVNVNLIK